MTLRELRSAGLFIALAVFISVPMPAVAASMSAPATTAAKLQAYVMPHRALYKMSLDSVRNGSQVQGADGVMYFEWADACDGWTVEQRLNLSLNRGEDFNVEIKSVYTTWELKDGTKYRFNYRNTVNGVVKDEYRGTAVLDAPGQKGLATYTYPEHKEIQLPVGSYFPTAHTMALVNAAIAHKPLFGATVFDGTDEHGMSMISAVIGPQKDVSDAAARTGLGQTPAIAWPIRMAFFPYDQEEATPDYEMDTTILPNGVSEFMLMDYGEFRLRGALQKVEPLSKPDC